VKCLIIEEETMCSNVLQRTHVRDIGLYLAGHELSPVLKIGATFAVFHWEGNDPSSSDFLKMTSRIISL
jgi:hypothetical protein